jgi:hypothetical protein
MDDNLDFSILQVPTNSDKAYRDTLCMAYVCSVMDLRMSDFETGVKPTIRNEIEKEAFLQMMARDLEIRIRRLLESK